MSKDKELTADQKDTIRKISYIGFAICLIFFLKASIFVSTSKSTTGTIVDIHSYRNSDRTMMYSPVFEFIDSHGGKYTVESDNSSSSSSYSKGQKVEILYSPESPQNAKINSIFEIWGAFLVIGFMSIIPFILSKSDNVKTKG